MSAGNQNARLIDLLARSVVLLAAVVAEARDLAKASASGDEWKFSGIAANFDDLATEAEPLIDAAEALVTELRDAQ